MATKMMIIMEMTTLTRTIKILLEEVAPMTTPLRTQMRRVERKMKMQNLRSGSIPTLQGPMFLLKWAAREMEEDYDMINQSYFE